MPIRPARFALLLLIAITGVGIPVGDALAQQTGSNREGRNEPVPVRRDRRQIDRSMEQQRLSDAVRRVERQSGGRVLSAERIPFDGRDVSRIKVVDATGRVRIYMDDPRLVEDPSRANRPRARTRDDDN